MPIISLLIVCNVESTNKYASKYYFQCKKITLFKRKESTKNFYIVVTLCKHFLFKVRKMHYTVSEGLASAKKSTMSDKCSSGGW